jgi:hypothetical protein
MFIEFQTTTQQLLTEFANRVRVASFCLTTPIADAIGPCGGPWLIDHIEVPTGSLSQFSDGVIELDQPITVHLVNVPQLAASGPAATAPCLKPAPSLKFHLEASVDDDGVPSMTVSYVGLFAPALGEESMQQIEGMLGGLLTPVSTKFDLGVISQILGTPVTATAAGIAVNQAGDRIATRIQLAGGGGAGNWDSFFSGQFKPHKSDHDWSVFLSVDLLTASIKTRMLASLQEPIEDDKFSLDSGPNTVYLPVPAKPTFLTTFSGEAIDACVCLWGEIDLDVDITGKIEMSVPEENSVEMDLKISWNLDDLEAFCCAFTAGIFWGFVGTNLLNEGEINWGEFLLGFGGGATLPVAFSAFIGVAHDTAGEQMAMPGWKKISDTHYQMKINDIDFSDLGSDFTMNGVFAAADGVAFGGTQGSIATLKTPVLHATVDQTGWQIRDPCGSPGMTASAAVQFLPTAFDQLPLHACEVKYVSDGPFGQFKDEYLGWSDAGAAIAIPYGAVVSEYAADPYPCQIMAITNGGVRVITFDPIPAITQQEVDTAVQMAILAQPVKCHEYLAEDDFWKGGKFNPLWAPDPFWDRLIQHWNVVIEGLDPGENLVVTDKESHPLAEITATAKGGAELVASVRADRGSDGGIILQREGGRANGRRGNVLIQQTPVQSLGKITAGGSAVDLSALSSSTIAVATSQGLAVYDLSAPRASQLLGFRSVARLRGVLSWQGLALGWGDGGLVSVAGDFERRNGGPVQAAAAGSRLFLLGEEGLEVYERGQSPTLHSGVQGDKLALGGGVLAAASQHALVFHDARSLRELGGVDLRGVDLLDSVRFASARAAFYAGDHERGTIYTISREHETSEAARYFRLPLLIGAKRVGNRLAKIDVNGRVEVYATEQSSSLER